jgi:drug/metabolite transporter (DMT)-like permease
MAPPTPNAGSRWALPLAIGALAFASIFFRKAAPTHPLVAASVRLLLAGVVLAPFVVRAARRRAIDRRFAIAGLAGGVAYAVHFGAWVTSLGLTTVAASVTLVTATPLLLGLVALATGRDRPEARHWASIAIAIAGLLLVGGADLATPGALAGDGLALLGAAAMAAFLLNARRLGDALDPWALSGIACATGGVLLAVAAVGSGVPFEIPTREAAVYLVLVTAVPQLIGHSLLTRALRDATPVTVGIATIGEPVGATLVGWLWLHEVPSVTTLAGCAIVLAAVVVALRPGRR